jgi:thermitase
VGRLSLSLALAVSLIVPASASAQEAIIVKRVPGLDRAERLAVRQDADVRLLDTLSLPYTEVVKPQGDASAALDVLKANPDVVYAELDKSVRAFSDDPVFDQEWGLENTGQSIYGQLGVADADIDAAEAWARSRGAGATVAVIDTGVQLDHPDLAGQFLGGYDFVNGDNTVETQDSTHGTHVSGTIAAIADNDEGIAGVAPEAKLIPVKVFGAPNTSAPESRLAEAFDYAGALGVRVVNASLGGLGTSSTVTAAINAHPNTLYVVAAGNSGKDASSTYPCNANAANVVCVGATDNRDERADFSNFSATYVDLFAPGVDVASALPTSSYGWMSGTSMATPHVAGVAALLASAKPSATTAELKAALLGSVDVPGTLTGLAVTAGRLNADKALTAVLSAAPVTPIPTPTPTPEPPVATSTPVPPVVTTPTPTPSPSETPAPAIAVVKSLKLSGQVTRKTSAKVTYSVSAGAKVTLTVTRAGCKGVKSCSASTSRWSEATKAGTRTFSLGHRVAGRTLSPGRYTLTVATDAGSRAVSFRVR